MRKAGQIGQSDATNHGVKGFYEAFLRDRHPRNGVGIKVIYRMSGSRKGATTVDPVDGLTGLADLRGLTSLLTKHEAEIAKSQGTALVRMDR